MPTPATTPPGREAPPIHTSVPYTAVQPLTLDSAAMLDLHQWLNRRRFKLFGDLRPWDQQDALEETFIRTLEFANQMRDCGALNAASFTIGLRVRAQRVTEYIRQRAALLAIRSLCASDQEILVRFYFEGQTQDQIRLALQLTATQFRLRKSRAISRSRLRASAILTGISRAAETVRFAQLSFSRAIAS